MSCHGCQILFRKDENRQELRARLLAFGAHSPTCYAICRRTSVPQLRPRARKTLTACPEKTAPASGSRKGLQNISRRPDVSRDKNFPAVGSERQAYITP